METTSRPIQRASEAAIQAVEPEATDVLGRFLTSLAERDFPALACCFGAGTRFRALLPRGLREAVGPEEPTSYFQRWFGAADQLELLDSALDTIGDRRHLAWRFRVHDGLGRRVIEQQAYATVQHDRIAELDLLCSGFRQEGEADPGAVREATTGQPPIPDEVLDASGESCSTLTPLIRTRLQALPAGAVLELRTSDPAAPTSLEAWCRLTGNELIVARGDTYYLRKR